MAKALSKEEVAELNALIGAHDARAMESLRGLDSFCVSDGSGQTPFDAAIVSDNTAAMEMLAEDKECLTFFAQVNGGLKNMMKYEGAPEGALTEVEDRLKRAFGMETCYWERTPLLQACRHGNRFAIELLLGKKVKTGQADILGRTELELCYEVGGVELLNFFVEACRKAKTNVAVNRSLLERMIAEPEMLKRLVSTGTLNAASRHFVFCLYCATLDVEGVISMLEAGYDINKQFNASLNPVFEVCTSQMLWELGHPDYPRLAYLYTKANGAPDSQSVTFGDDSGVSYGEAMQRKTEKDERARSLSLASEELDKQLGARLQLIELMLRHGLDVSVANRKRGDFFVSHIVRLKEPRIVRGLLERGFDMRAGENEKFLMDSKELAELNALIAARGEGKAEPESPFIAVEQSDLYWELPVESTLMAKTLPEALVANRPFTARVTFNNAYGPLVNTRLYLRVGVPSEPTSHDGLATRDDWQAMECKEETVYLEGERVLRADRSQPMSVAGEIPWSSTYEQEISLPPGTHSLEIGIESADAEELNLVISDWVVEV